MSTQASTKVYRSPHGTSAELRARSASTVCWSSRPTRLSASRPPAIVRSSALTCEQGRPRRGRWRRFGTSRRRRALGVRRIPCRIAVPGREACRARPDGPPCRSTANSATAGALRRAGSGRAGRPHARVKRRAGRGRRGAGRRRAVQSSRPHASETTAACSAWRAPPSNNWAAPCASCCASFPQRLGDDPWTRKW